MDIRLEAGACTHPGRVRSRNEDSLIVTDSLFAVADGMGGHDAGDVASALAVAALSRLDAGADGLSRPGVLRALRTADDEISHAARRTEQGMGTTLTGLAVIGATGPNPSLLVFNVGDSRTSRFREGTLVQLTRDHSVVQELIDQGTIAPDDALTHPERHVITRSLGTGYTLEIDSWADQPHAGDRYLIASDGLSKELRTEQIESILVEITDPQAAVDRLVDDALEAGGRDNISVVLVDIIAFPAEVVDDSLTEDTRPRNLSGALNKDDGIDDDGDDDDDDDDTIPGRPRLEAGQPG